jgi:hypothetical protein
MPNNQCFWRMLIAVVLLLTGLVLVAQATLPRGWLLTGTKPSEYEVGVDVDQKYQGHATAFLKSKSLNADGFGTLMQSIKAEQYLGRKVRLSGLVKSEEVLGWAGLWMRVDKEKSPVAFDNMENRAIKGTTGWQRYDVVLDVPTNATAISFGILLAGSGVVWLNGTKFDVVDADVPVTNTGEKVLPEKPINLDFAN